MTDKEWSKVVYAHGGDMAFFVSILRLAPAGLYTESIASVTQLDIPDDIPVVTSDDFYSDAGMSLQDITSKVNEGKMHPRAISLAMELLL